MNYGFVKVAAAVPRVKVADCKFNSERLEGLIAIAEGKGVQILTFPEMCITGYTCGDLFAQQLLLEQAEMALMQILNNPRQLDIISILGMPVVVNSTIINAAVAIQKGKILGVVLKTYLPNYKEFYEQRGLYDVDGTLLKGYRRPYVGKIHSLVAVDMEQDVILELLSLQNISGLNREDLLGKLAGVWSYDGSSGWKLKSKTFYSGGKNKDDKFHRSYNEKNWRILPRQAVHDSSSVTYPVFTAIAAPEVQNKLNGDFAIIAGPYLQNLATGGCELDYTLTFVSEKFISIVFFGVLDEGEKEIFAKIPLNIDVQTGAQLALGDVLNLRDADLLPVLRLLTKKDKVDFSKGIPESWYYNGTNFVFCQRSETGEWLEATVAASDLKKFLLKPELF